LTIKMLEHIFIGGILGVTLGFPLARM
jgi:hypothetical protein